jgi:hypothetical protein
MNYLNQQYLLDLIMPLTCCVSLQLGCAYELFQLFLISIMPSNATKNNDTGYCDFYHFCAFGDACFKPAAFATFVLN